MSKLLTAFTEKEIAIREKEIAIRDKEIAQLITLKDKDKVLNDKDIALVCKDRDHVIALKEKDIMIAAQANQIGSLEKEILESRSACTSRGIFEFALKASQTELQLKGTFNAKAVCDEIISRRSKY